MVTYHLTGFAMKMVNDLKGHDVGSDDDASIRSSADKTTTCRNPASRAF